MEFLQGCVGFAGESEIYFYGTAFYLRLDVGGKGVDEEVCHSKAVLGRGEVF